MAFLTPPTAGVLAGVSCAAALVLQPRLRRSPLWRATLTPLASIIGSGFLVLAPILVHEFGLAAPLVMLALCAAAYGFGAVMRFNIAHAEVPHAPAVVRLLETLSGWALCFAYVVSVSYYLRLFGAFLTVETPWNGALASRVATSAVLLLIGVAGLRGGLARLERLEAFSVSFKLIVIGGLLLALLLYAAAETAAHGVLADDVRFDLRAQLCIAFGLVITVQGFETSRYLGARYDATTRIRTMRYAQGISTLIYLLYIGLVTLAVPASAMGLTETAVLDLGARVSVLLPPLLVLAALAAQFSAAVADTLGGGGLAEELSGGRLRSRAVYPAMALAGIALIWLVDVFGIIAWASRAFALYYGLQALLAARLALTGGAQGRLRACGFAVLALLAFAIVVFGRSPE